jgi:chromosome partitioning protein
MERSQPSLVTEEAPQPVREQDRSARPRASIRRLMFASQKGGVGKTASAINIAACFGQMERRVLLVDTDPIGSISACFGMALAKGHPGLFGIEQWDLSDLAIPEVAPNVDLLPYAEDRRPVDLTQLQRCIAEVSERAAGEYDIAVIDTRPSVAEMTRRLCQVVDEVIVVLQCHPLAYRTLGAILGQLRDARADGAPARLLGLLLTMVDEEDPLQRRLEAHIRANLGESLLPICIPRDPAVGEGLMADRPAVLFRPDSASARAYTELTQYLVALERRAKMG